MFKGGLNINQLTVVQVVEEVGVDDNGLSRVRGKHRVVHGFSVSWDLS